MNRETQILPSVVEAIGETPLVELSRLTRNVEGRILAKLDYLNPGFSKKDRIAKQIIEDAVEAGELAPGQTVVELTSGNTGTGLAIVCGIMGHPFVAVMSRGNSIERARMMAALGAEVILVDQLSDSVPGQVSGPDLEKVALRTQELVKERDAFRADQFTHQGGFRAHYLHTGPEFWTQSNGSIGAFCDFVGSGGTFGGCAAYFKEQDENIRCYVIEPETAPPLSGSEISDPGHRIQGGGYSMAELKYLNRKHVEGYLKVSDQEATLMARRLAREEGIFAGFSSGANVACALKLLEGECRGKTVAVMICDSGLKYLSTDLWEEG